MRSGVLRFGLAALSGSFALALSARASDCDGDGTPDDAEVVAGAPDCNGNGIPDACDLVGTPLGLSEATRIPFADSVFDLEVADLDGDGAKDVAACTSVGLLVFLQRPAGGFEVRRFLSPGCNGLRAGDLDGDGDVDLAINADALVVMKNSGAGLFDSGEGHGALTGHVQTTPLDMDADGDVDLVSITRDTSDVSILFNAGNGTYPSQLRFGGSIFPSHLVAADLDSDGDPDLAVASQASPEVVVFPNADGRATFGPGTSIGLERSASDLVAAELDGSGSAELLAYLPSPGRLCILRRQGGGFTRECRLTGGDNVSLMVAADSSSDGATDLFLIEVAVTCATPSVSLFRDVGAMGTRQPPTADLGFVSGAAIVQDVFGDSTPEIVIVGQGFQPEPGIRFLELGSGPPLPDCDGNGVPDECDLAGSDWNFNLRLDSCEIQEGLGDCDANGIPDAQDPDCNGNGMPDACDIAAGTQQDLDADGVPDGCEPRPGSFADCNGNGVSDETDVASGTSGDCNANAIPDECDIRRYFAEPRIRLPVAGVPVGVALPDLDADGSADAAVLRAPDFSGTALTKKTSLILYRNGVSWSPGRDFPAGIMPAHILSGDIDGNGVEDLLTLSREAKCLSPGFVAAFINRGEGDLERPRVFAQELRPTLLATGDLDGDGDLDAALAGEEEGHRIFVFSNDGSGRFERGAEVELPGPPSDIIASDLDGDSDLDLAVGLGDPASIALFRNDAGASFRAGPALPASFPPVRLAAADLEGKGSVDLVSAVGPISANAFSLFESDAAGGFEDERTVSLPVSAKLVHAFDADADGIDDLAFAGPFFVPGSSPDGEDVLYLRSRGGRDFDTPVALDRRIFVYGMAAGDTDADGDIDLAVADPAWSLIRFYRNEGKQGFGSDFRHSVGSGINALIASDLDRDGYDDVIVASGSTNELVLLPSSNGTIAGGRSIALDFTPQAVAAADLDGDGDGDLVAGGGLDVQALFREEGGSYLVGPQAVLSSTPMHVVASDLDGDGDVDVATANVLLGSGFNDNASFLANDGAGRLGAPRNFAIGIHPRSLCAADLDSDGDTDLVASNSDGDSTLSFLWNGGAGDFSRADTRPSREMRGLLATDLDGDGLKELIGAAFEGVSILENGGGAFVERLIPVRGDGWLLEANWYGFAGADLEDDGDIDLAIADPTRLFILENRGGLFPHIPEVFAWRRTDGSGASGPSFDPSLLIALPHLDGNRHRDFVFGFPFGSEVVVFLDRGPVSRDLDRNGVPDECNAAGAPFRRGEANGDGLVDLSDAISVLRWLFSEGSEMACLEAADGNDDGRVDLSDPVWVLRHLFLGAPPPYEPFLSCGEDPTPDALGCASFPECER